MQKKERKKTKLEEKFYNWLRVDAIENHPEKSWSAVTLSLKPRIKRKDGTYQKLTDTENGITKVTKELLKRLDFAVYKHAYKRKSKTLYCVPVQEKNAYGDRYHIHMLLELPKRYQNKPEVFKELVVNTAKNLRWFESGKNAQHDVQVLSDTEHAKNWLGYILKKAGNRGDNIDLENMCKDNENRKAVS